MAFSPYLSIQTTTPATHMPSPSKLSRATFLQAQPAPRGALLDGGEVWVKRV
jgi:hypothetical protein